MKEIILIGTPSTATTRWLRRYFDGRASLQDFTRHFSEKYRSSLGTVIAKRCVYSRIVRDEKRGHIRKQG